MLMVTNLNVHGQTSPNKCLIEGPLMPRAQKVLVPCIQTQGRCQTSSERGQRKNARVLYRALAILLIPEALLLQIFGGEAFDWFDTMLWWSTEVAVQAYDRFLGRAGLGPMPRNVSFACCSQFAVTKEAVRVRSRFFWQQNLHYLKHNNIEASNAYSKTYMVGKSLTSSFFLMNGNT